MKISLSWLKQYVTLDASAEEITHAITFLGFEVEQVIRTGVPPLQHVVVGEVLTRLPHPNADKLTVCTVDVGPDGGVKTIVCGAPNHQVGDRVLVALPGAVLPGDFKIKQSKIRGQLSDGMMCSPDELGLGGADGKRLFAAHAMGQTGVDKRAERTGRPLGSADRRTEVHHCLGIVAGAPLGRHFGLARGDRLLRLR